MRYLGFFKFQVFFSICFFLFYINCSIVYAQETISYQTYLKESRTVDQPGSNLNLFFPIASQVINFEFSFIVNGLILYVENDTVITDEEGFISTQIGNERLDEFSLIRWDLIRDSVLLRVKWKKGNEVNFRSIDSLSLNSVPYSFSSYTSRFSHNGIKSIRKNKYSYTFTLYNDSSFVVESLRLPPIALITPHGPVVGCVGDSVSLSCNYISDSTLRYSWIKNRIIYPFSKKIFLKYPEYPLIDTIVLNVSSNLFSPSFDTIYLTSFVTPKSDSIWNLLKTSLNNSDTFCPNQWIILPRIYGSKWIVNNDNSEVKSSSISGLDTLYFRAEGLVYLYNVSIGNCPSSVFSYLLFCVRPSARIWTNGPIEICTNKSSILTAYHMPGFRYKWLHNNLIVSNEFQPTLKVTIPGNYRVIVSIGLCSDTSSPIEVHVNPLPLHNLRLVGSKDFCEGSSVVLKANNNPYYRYYWNVDGVFLNEYFSDSLIIDSTSIVYLKAINDDRCISYSDTFSFTELPVPVVLISSNRLNNFICANDSITLFTQAQPNFRYQWYRDNILIQNEISPIIKPRISGIYRLRSKNNFNCESFSNPINVLIADTPVFSLSLSRPTMFCLGDTLTLTASSLSSDSLTFSWYLNNTIVFSNHGLSSSYKIGSTGQIRVKVTNSYGCETWSGAVSTIVSVPPSVGSLVGNDSICILGTTTFVPSVVGGSWSSSANGVATVSSSGLVTGISAGTATITYTVPGTGGCTSVSVTRTVRVTARPTAGSLAGNDSICVAGTTTFVPSVLGGSWSSSANGVASVSSSGLVTGISAGTATITYTVPGTGGCTSVSVTRAVRVTAQPTAGSMVGNDSICVLGTTTFVPSVVGGSWSSSANGVATVSSSGLVTGISAGTATITYTVPGTGGCTSVSVTRMVTVTARPTAGMLSGDDSICINETTTFVPTVAGGTWSSSANGVATVDSFGVVTGISAGTATISYLVHGAGVCSSNIITRIVSVNSNNTLILSSSSNNNQSVVVNDPIIPIIYNTTGATGVNVIGLPPGITGSWSGNIYTISGAPSVVGIYDYIISTIGGCGANINAGGRIEVRTP